MRRVATGLAMGVALMFGAAAARADPTESRFSDARFETGGLILMQASASQNKFVLLWVYQSKLGQYLNQRAPSPAEVAEMRRLCQAMDKVARRQSGRALDGYGIEFADGGGDTARLPVSRRAVFFFWAKEGVETCAQRPSKGRIS